MRQIFRKLSLVFFTLLSTACVSVGTPSSHSREIQLVDYSQVMGTFTDGSIIEGRGFDAVTDFSTRYEFACRNKQYQITIKSYNDGRRMRSSVTRITENDVHMNDAELNRVDSILKEAHVIGPVGLKCESEGSSDRGGVITFGTAIIDDGKYHYTLKPKTFVFGEMAFKAVKP